MGVHESWNFSRKATFEISPPLARRFGLTMALRNTARIPPCFMAFVQFSRRICAFLIDSAWCRPIRMHCRCVWVHICLVVFPKGKSQPKSSRSHHGMTPWRPCCASPAHERPLRRPPAPPTTPARPICTVTAAASVLARRLSANRARARTCRRAPRPTPPSCDHALQRDRHHR